MVKVAIIYSTGHGHTRTVAEHIQKGASAFAGVQVDVMQILPEQIGANGRWFDETIMQNLAAADAIVFGAPTYMGSMHGLFKLFLEHAFAPWVGQEWKDKIAAGFTNSSSRSGDKLIALEQLAIFGAQMNMIWVGVGDQPGGNYSASQTTDVNLGGSWLGLATQSIGDAAPEDSLHAGDRLTAERFGRRIARTASRWRLGAQAFPAQPVSAAETRRRNIAGLDEWRRFDD